MKNTDLLHLILPGIHTAGQPEFHDFAGKCAVRAAGRYQLAIAGEFPAALVRFDIELVPGQFDYETLYCALNEYPSGRYVKTGPWDLSMDLPERMQVPTLDVHWRGAHYGSLWFEMPSPEDIRDRRLGGTFALLFEKAGTETIRLTVPEHERHRLDFSMVEKITIRLDNRAIPHIEPRAEWDPATPWLLLGDQRPADLPKLRAVAGGRYWAAMADEKNRYFASSQSTVRGAMSLCNAAFMALAGDALALAQLVDLLESRRQTKDFLGNSQMVMRGGRIRWSEEVRWLMGHGWNDYGFSWVLLENACVYQWLQGRLPAVLREWLKRNLLFYGRELYRFGIFQRQYAGAQGAILNCHAMVPYLAVGALGAVFLREAPETQAWLDFAFGRMRETALLLRDAAVCPSALLWGATFQYQLIELLRAVTGEDHRQTAYFQTIPTALWRHRYFHKAEGFPVIKRYYERLTAACYASQLDNEECQWYYQRLRREEEESPAQALPASFLDILWHTDKPGRSPDDKTKNASVLFRDASYALLQTNYECPRFAVSVKAGPLGKTIALRLESYSGAFHGELEHHGTFDVWINGFSIVRSVTGYRQSFCHGNFVLVDGDGYYLDGAYLMGRGDMSRVAWLRTADLQESPAYLDIVNTRSYRADLHLELARRRIYFDALEEWAVITDDLRSLEEHDYTLCLHAAAIEPDEAGAFRCYYPPDAAQRAAAAGVPERVGPLYVACACNQPATCRTVVGSMVLPYTYGVTHCQGEKVDGHSGKVDAQQHAPPADHRIQCAVNSRCQAVQFITAFATQKITCTPAGDSLLVRTPQGERRLLVS